jgi:hypothetical protein
MAAPDDIVILRIELEDIEPLIWRRVAVPVSMNLEVVHSVIQGAMGWLDCHFEFAANEHKYAMLLPDDPDWNERVSDATKAKLTSLLSAGLRELDTSTTWATAGSTGSLLKD